MYQHLTSKKLVCAMSMFNEKYLCSKVEIQMANPLGNFAVFEFQFYMYVFVILVVVVSFSVVFNLLVLTVC